MGGIRCECGRKLSDSTDMLSYKARFVADQDWDDLLEGLDRVLVDVAQTVLEQQVTARREAAPAELPATDPAPEALEKLIRSHSRRLYQLMYHYSGRDLFLCYGCGRLYVEDARHQYGFRAFQPGEAAVPRDLLRSAEGDSWRGLLYGDWGRPGEHGGALLCDVNDTESGYEVFETWEALEARYHEVFSRLREKGILRHGVLRSGYTVIHQWPDECAASAAAGNEGADS